MARKRQLDRRLQGKKKNAPTVSRRYFVQHHTLIAKILGVAATFILLKIAVILLIPEDTRVWGLDYPRYILSWDVWFALLIPMIFCIPGVAMRIAAFFTRKSNKRSWLLYGFSGLALTALLLFLAQEFQVLYSFLGDGSYGHAEVFRLNQNPYQYSPLLDKATAYLTGQTIRFLNGAMDYTKATEPFIDIGFASILILIPGLFVLLRKQHAPEAILFLTVFLLNPALLFFFGYIELYALQYVFTSLFLASLYGWFTKRTYLWPSALLLMLAIGFGGSSVVFVPLLMFIIAARYIKNEHVYAKIASGLIALQITGFIVLLSVVGSDPANNYILPVVSCNIPSAEGLDTGWFGYSIFSPAHLADILNEVLLIAGLPVVLALVLIPALYKRKLFTGPELQLAAISATSGALLLLGGRVFYGMARDWDAAVFGVVGLLFAAVVVMQYARTEKLISLSVLLPVLVVFSFGTMYTWVKLNHLPASATRLEALVDMDQDLLIPQVTYSGYENLRKYYLASDQKKKYFKLVPKMIATGWNRIALLDEATITATQLPSIAEVKQELEWIIPTAIKETHLQYPSTDVRYSPKIKMEEMLASIFLSVDFHAPELVSRYLQMVQDKLPDWKYYQFVKIATDTTIALQDKILHMDGIVTIHATNAHIVARIGDYQRLAGRNDSAIAYYERVLQLDPYHISGAYFELAKLYAFYSQDINKAIATLETGIQNCQSRKDIERLREFYNDLVEYRNDQLGLN